ncbi:ATP-binding cassette domain-containing protein [Ahrensia marina]|uniref:ABC transporter ATP-binding protein n=1 Tax=Ahrensia marina TaxID=1514904 RepID=A0A0N0E8R4_9HYPH|nr:ATP-binding cassette domain-containing protein [Ahrensia marina]KPB02665.1 ABC transporter ATP-binding protein [Ahrensia marina]
MSEQKNLLSLRNIHKAFGGVIAIQDFSLDLKAGEIVALVGDNGAGKSTLIKIISGVYTPTSGDIELDGEAISFRDASTARAKGIEVVYQDLALADQQPVFMNMFLGRELTKPPFGLLDKQRMREESQQLVDELDVRIPSAASTISELSGGQRQGIAIARATHWASKLVLLDEPTAALGVAETARVEDQIAKLKEKNLAILIISHSLDQVFKLSDRICVLRRGKQIGVRETKNTDKNEIVSMITGVA